MELTKKLASLFERSQIKSQRALADMIRANPTVVGRWFSGKGEPTPAQYVQLARVFGVTAESLVDDGMEPEPKVERRHDPELDQLVGMIESLGRDRARARLLAIPESEARTRTAVQEEPERARRRNGRA